MRFIVWIRTLGTIMGMTEHAEENCYEYLRVNGK
jgi:hypothetical protein